VQRPSRKPLGQHPGGESKYFFLHAAPLGEIVLLDKSILSVEFIGSLKHLYREFPHRRLHVIACN
jgi:hypothetical protein